MEANVGPDQAAAAIGSDRVMRVAFVWGVRFAGECLAEALGRDPSVSVVGLYADLFEAVAVNAGLQADVILMDARMPDGAAAVRRALDVAPGLRIIVSAVSETEDDVVNWAEAGVLGYIPRTATLGDFVRLLWDIHNGEQLCSGRVVAGLLRRIAQTANDRPRRTGAVAVPTLTRRERQTAELIKSGLTDKEIARRLNISVATTKSHVHNILGKLHARRRSEVADHFKGHLHYSR